jgi:ABC-type polysaccharide/polyol phosphate export permease
MKLNPMTIFIFQYQKVLFYNDLPTPKGIAYLIAISILVLYIGIKIFDAYKEGFAEEV